MIKKNHKSTDVLYVYSCCQITNGVNRSLVVDLQRHQIYFIPKGLAELIIEHEYKINIHKVLDTLVDEDVLTFKEYIDFIISNEIGCIIDNGEDSLFPKLPLVFESPSQISNTIIDFNVNYLQYYQSILAELSKANCYTVQIRSFSVVEDLFVFNELLDSIKLSSIKQVELLTHYYNGIEKDIPILIEKNNKIEELIIYNAPYEKREHHHYNTGFTIYIKEMVNKESCGVVNSTYFAINVTHFSESQTCNTCLNRKISIDIDGHIKNCPSMEKKFGNIKDTTLEAALEKNGFKAYWKINKDKIKVCQDCEFRHICTDCRAYIEDPKDKYSKPLKFGYNPYTNEWEDWSTHPLKQKTIQYYNKT